MVRALWRRGCGLWLSRPCADPAADGHVPLLGQPERLAAADPGDECSLSAQQDLAGAGVPGWRLGARFQPRRDDHGARGTDGRAEREHRLDLERHRQAQGRLGVVARRARGDDGLPVEPPDQRGSARQGRRAAVEFRPCHGPGRLVRLPCPGRAGRGG